MSSPIAIRRSSISSSDSALSASPASPAQTLYVPIHKRSASSASSVTSLSAPSSPPSPIINTPSTLHSHIYSADFLLSLQPFAAVGIKEKMLAACPEAVINRRVRKRIEHTSRTASKSTTTKTTTPTLTAPAAAAAATRRITPRRARFSGRAPERRRQALSLHHDPSRGLHNASTPLPLISV